MDAEARRKAIEVLVADDLSRQIFLYFSSAMPMGNSETFAGVENSPRFKNPHPETWAAFQAHRAKYIDLLKDAVAGWDMRIPATSILDSAAAEVPNTVYIYDVPDMEKIPEAFRPNARALPGGGYRISGKADLAAALGLPAPAGGTPPEKKAPPDPAKFEISRQVVAKDFQQYRQLHDLAEKEGKLVTIVD